MPAETPAFFVIARSATTRQILRILCAVIASGAKQSSHGSSTPERRVCNNRKRPTRGFWMAHASLVRTAGVLQASSLRGAEGDVAIHLTAATQRWIAAELTLLAMTRLNGIDLDHPFRTGASAHARLLDCFASLVRTAGVLQASSLRGAEGDVAIHLTVATQRWIAAELTLLARTRLKRINLDQPFGEQA